MSELTFIPISHSTTPWQVQRRLEDWERVCSGPAGADYIGFESGGVFAGSTVGDILIELSEIVPLGGGQPLNANLTAISGLVTAANQFFYATGVASFAMADISDYGLDLIQVADAGAARTLLELGNAATRTVGTGAGQIRDAADSTYTDDRVASGLRTPTGVVAVSTAIAPTSGYVLTATSATSATWQDSTEACQDAIGDILTDSDTIEFVYDDGVPSIAASVIDSSITYAKIQDVSTTDRLLGRLSGGAGEIEEVACTATGRNIIGAANVAAQRALLELGDSALLDVGETPGTVAAGTAPTAAVVTHVAIPDPHTQYALESALGTAAYLDTGTVVGTVATGDSPGTAITNHVAELDPHEQYALESSLGNVVSRNIGTGAGQVRDAADATYTNDRTASGLRTATTVVAISANAAPTVGQVLTALSDSTSSWQSPSVYTNENAQDAVGAILTDTSTIDLTYDDAGNSITADIKPASVSYSLMQNVSATDKVLGRSTAGAGSPEEISCTAAGRAVLAGANAAAQRTSLQLGNSSTLDTGTTSTTVALGNAAMFPKIGNMIRVDAVFGDDGTGVRNGQPFLTIQAAIAVAQAGDTIWIMPGTYNLSAGITIPASVVLNGISIGAVTIQMLNVGTATTLITLSNSSVLENLTLKLTATDHYVLTGILYPGTTTTNADVQNINLTVDNSTASNGGSSNVYGIRSTGTGVPPEDTDCLRSSCVTVLSAGGGTKRAIVHDTAAGTFSCRDVNTRVTRTGTGVGTYIGVESNFAGAVVLYRVGTISGTPTADVSQTLGTLILGVPNVYHSSANGLGFGTLLTPATLDWGDSGSVSSGTRYMYRGTATASASNESKTRFAQKTIVWELSIRAITGPGDSRTDTWTIRKNGVDTALTGSLVGAATSVLVTNISVSFAAGDDISLKMVCAGGSTTSDVVVSVSYC